MIRFAKFLDKQFKVKNDEMGVPSIIIVDGKEKSLVLSVDRHYMLIAMSKFLSVKLVLTDDMSKVESNAYIDGKYKEYMDFVMNL